MNNKIKNIKNKVLDIIYRRRNKFFCKNTILEK